jgi:hypothetical protein
MIKRSKTYTRLVEITFLAILFLAACGGPYFPFFEKPPAPEVISPINMSQPGNAESGQALFMGKSHFEHEGPPCMGCHSVGENGILGGGAMGPNLTNVSTRRSQTEILGVLSNTGQVTSSVMKPIYTDAPLTAQEQADLLAFLQASAGQPETNREGWVIGISLIGAAFGAAVIGVIYRNRLRSVRRALVKRALSEQ